MNDNGQTSERQHRKLDNLKHRLATEVWGRFSPEEIRRHSIENLTRWKSQGVWSLAYEEWMNIVVYCDDPVLEEALIGISENSNRLRQSAPYVGMLEKELVRAINESEFGKDDSK